MKTILACLTGEEHAADVLSAAVPLARRHMAHLIGLHALEALIVYPGTSMHIPDVVYESMAQSQTKTADLLEAIFQDKVRPEDFVSEWRCVKAQTTPPAARIVEAARSVDLVIMAQADASEDRADRHYVLEHVIRQSGRPVLHVPNGYRGDVIGNKVIIGWSPTREATRAVHDAIPLMMPGADVAIVSVSGGDGAESAGATELARALDRHGFKAEVVQRTAAKANIGEMLEREALERGADLIVTGAFGHSRVYDFVIGAVTLELMHSAVVPVLFAR